MLFLKLFAIAVVFSLLAFALMPDAGIMFLLKALALGLAVSIAVAVFYPSVRGVKAGDSVSVVSNSFAPTIFGKAGVVMNTGRVNNEVRIRLDNGKEAVGIIESYEGLFSLPRVRLVYEEKLVE